MNLTTQTVLLLIRNVLFGQPLPEEWSSEIDWQNVYSETQKQAIVSLFTDSIPNLPMAEEVKERWFNEINVNSLAYYTIVYTQGELDGKFQSAGIRYLTLKGIAAAQYYPKPSYRDFGDVDVLVHAEDFDRAMELLKDSGFKLVNEDYSRHARLRRKRILLELHRYYSLAENRAYGDTWINSRLTDELDHPGTVWIDPEYEVHRMRVEDGGRISVPSDGINGIVLLQHLNQHLDVGIGYRHVLDFLLYAARFLNDEAWYGNDNDAGFGDMARAIGLEKLAKVTVRMGQMYFGFPQEITWCVDADEGICHEMFEYVTNHGNFGRKEDSELTQVLNRTRGTLMSRLKFEQNCGLHYWKAAQKHVFLRPFAWLYGICRHLRTMTRKGLWKDFGKSVATSRKQSDFLDRLGVWQRFNRE